MLTTIIEEASEAREEFRLKIREAKELRIGMINGVDKSDGEATFTPKHTLLE